MAGPNWEAMRMPAPKVRGAAVARTPQQAAVALRERQILAIREAGLDPQGMTPAQRAEAVKLIRAPHERERRAKQAHVKRLHHARLREAMPPWADIEAIRAVYDEARRLTRETGIPHEVDHIEPLLGKAANGLHVHYNLRVITRTENRRKGNRRS